MARKVSRKVGGIPLTNMMLAGLIKPFSERALAPVVGNGTILSGGAKTIAAIAINQFAGRGTLQDAAAIALCVDGVEDIVHAAFGGGGLFGYTQPDVFGGAI